MKGDALIRQEGIKILLEKLGKVGTERFISLIIREPFDYTEWQEDLFKDLSVRELSEQATKYINDNENIK